MYILSLPTIIKTIAYLLTSIAIIFEIKDFINDKEGEKHRDIISILSLIINMVLIHYTTIK